MAPQLNVEFVILKLIFSPHLHPDHPKIILKRKKHSPSAATSQVRDWFNRIILGETAKVPADIKVRYSLWNIDTGNESLFIINGFRFDKILVVFGEENAHWIFYQNLPMSRKIASYGRLPVNYCGCCINHQYLEIVELIKDWLLQEIGPNF